MIIGAGVTLYEAKKAADKLQSENVEVIVMDPFTIKPLDKDLIVKSAKRAENRIITVEDHYQAGGITFQYLNIFSMSFYFVHYISFSIVKGDFFHPRFPSIGHHIL